MESTGLAARPDPILAIGWRLSSMSTETIDLNATRYPGPLQGVLIPENKRSAHDDERDAPCRWLWVAGRNTAGPSNGIPWDRSWVFSVESCMMQIESHQVAMLTPVVTPTAMERSKGERFSVDGSSQESHGARVW